MKIPVYVSYIISGSDENFGRGKGQNKLGINSLVYESQNILYYSKGIIILQAIKILILDYSK